MTKSHCSLAARGDGGGINACGPLVDGAGTARGAGWVGVGVVVAEWCVWVVVVLGVGLGVFLRFGLVWE